MVKVSIRPLADGDRTDWDRLWQGYCTFYQTTLPSTISQELWRRLHDPQIEIHAIVAENESGELIGLAHYLLHPYTWGNSMVCYLEDLYVSEAARGSGVGRALIDALIQLGKTSAWARVYWMTNEDNQAARHLYDRYVKADGFVRYLVRL